jgi:AsmA family/AsmA-like C-terminal region
MVRSSRRKLRMWAMVVIALLVLSLVPPFINVNRYRSRVAEAISRALGREVTVSSIELKLLPQPELVLFNFVVGEDSSFGAEPMLRAPSVTAALRLTSMWRGRLEIGTLDLDDPSLNLVRRADGHWNLEELVERASQGATAPTARTRPESRPRFPYVEASSGRINFKLGEVKKVFAFTDADFALWQETEQQWGVRLEARPMRSDVGVSDAGVLKLEGTFQRASSLRSTPVNLKLTFTEGALGQISKLIYGRDRGWRGSVSSTATLAGTPAALGVTFDAQVDDFRRYDIALGEALRLRVHCTATYSGSSDAPQPVQDPPSLGASSDGLRDVQCESPVGSGVLRVRGDAQDWLADSYHLDVSAVQIPAERVVALARHVKKDLPSDLTATGGVEAVLTIRKQQAESPVWSGGGRTQQLVLHSDVLKHDLEIGEVQFLIPQAAPSHPARVKRATPALPKVSAGLRALVNPFPLSLGAASPATAAATFNEQGYTATLSGDAELARLLDLARALGVGTPGIGLSGAAKIDLTVSGSWVGFAPPVPSGRILLHNATAELQGVNEPLQIAVAAVSLQNQEQGPATRNALGGAGVDWLSVTSFSAGFAKGPVLSGSMTFPVHCTGPEMCVLHFDVRSDQASIPRLEQLLNPSFRRRPWYRLLAPWQRGEDALLKLHADGHFSVDRVDLGNAVANNLTGSVELDTGKLRLSDLRAELLGGRHAGQWTADFTQSPPQFSGSGNVSKLSMAQLATLMDGNWATGAMDARYSLAMQGASAAALRKSAAGSADFSWSAGSLRHLALDGRAAPMTFSAFSGTVVLKSGSFTLVDGKLQAGAVSYAVNGTTGYERNLDFRLERGGGNSYVISGTLEKPRVVSLPTPPAEAALR